jgi:methylthioribose-1-phosphate isomerase
LDDEDSALVIIDQTLLPNEKRYVKLYSLKEIWDAIYHLKVRGAPAIGITAAYGVYLGVKQSKAADFDGFYLEFKQVKDYLASSRPTAVNLFWALNRMENRLLKDRNKDIQEIKSILKDEAELIREEDEGVCKSIGEYALTLLQPGWGILTHCNAGTIATAKYGTALAPLYLGKERGYDFKVYADETRPLLQGARLTAWELKEADIDVTLICDNMASIVMKEGRIQAVLVGCDRVAANGDTANKIGTSGVAILAKEYKIPMYICGPTSTIDVSTRTGDDIIIEERGEDEITCHFGKRTAPKGVKVYNPAFDVTKARYITAIITEKGVIYPPFEEGIARIFGE